MESAKPPHVKKAKKKPVKDEMDRIKQAEKKKRRLEKALATSAAIRSELEMKKQKKKEEQQRLDDEGAAIAEAVALHVLLGEDSEDPSNILLKKDDDFDDWHHATRIGFFMEGSSLYPENLKRCSLESMEYVPSGYGSGSDWNHFGDKNNYSSSWPFENDFCFHGLGNEETWSSSDDMSAGLIAAQAVSSLQIGEEVQFGTGYYNRY